MTYDQRAKRLQERQEERSKPKPTFYEIYSTIVILGVVIGFIWLMVSDITVSEIIGWMIGFTIVMLPITLFFFFFLILFK